MENTKVRVLVTGANGYVGAGIYSYLKQFFETYGTYSKDLLFPELIKMNVTNAGDVSKIIKKIKPDFIVHTIANPSAKWCETNQKDAVNLNEEGTKYIVDEANLISAKVVYISSFAAINPVNLYGKTKLAAEEITKKTNAGWVILRPSLIMGYSPNTKNDRPFNRLLKNITENKPAIFDDSWKFQPTELFHLCEVVRFCIQRQINQEIIPISVPELKTRFDLAKDILAPFGIQVASIDEKDSSPVFKDGQEKLKQLKLPVYSYKEMIGRIIKDIKKNVICK